MHQFVKNVLVRLVCLFILSLYSSSIQHRYYFYVWRSAHFEINVDLAKNWYFFIYYLNYHTGGCIPRQAELTYLRFENPHIIIEKPIYSTWVAFWYELWNVATIDLFFYDNANVNNITFNGERYWRTIANFYFPKLEEKITSSLTIDLLRISRVNDHFSNVMWTIQKRFRHQRKSIELLGWHSSMIKNTQRNIEYIFFL